MRRSIGLVLILFLIYNLIFTGKIYPNTFVANINLGGKSPATAVALLSNKVEAPKVVKLKAGEEVFEIETKDIGLNYDFEKTIQRAYNLARTGNPIYDSWQRIKISISGKNIGLVLKLDGEKLDSLLSVISGQISVASVPPSVKITNGIILIDKGKTGTEVDQKLLRAEIEKSLSLLEKDDIQIPVQEIGLTLTDQEAQEFKQRAEKYLGKGVNLNFEYFTYKITTDDILNLLDPRGRFLEKEMSKHVFEIAKSINRDPQNPKFEFLNGKVSEFLPAKDGIELDTDRFKEVITENLNSLAESEEKQVTFEIPVKRTPPDTTTEEVNDLGIKELIGRGTSRFKGSIPSRIHNIKIATSYLNGILIKPGETFSFNNALGDVSKFTGYQKAYVIREGKTVLGDGGGVCQVSTTLFRAALKAGLPILERQAHAYRVGYYEQDSPPGLDATVYGPSPDLKIKNDTPAHILIQSKADTKNYSLVFELYGTSDGRVATISKPITSNAVPPGEDLYIDDPTLPVGTVKQTEHKASGAKVTFNYLVQRNGETIYKKTFISNYRPWQAVYLRGVATQ